MTQALTQFVVHLISMAITAFVVVWIINRFTKEPKHHFTYEYKDVSFMLPKDGDCILSEALNEYGKDGWEVYQIIANPMGVTVFLKRTNIHTDENN